MGEAENAHLLTKGSIASIPAMMPEAACSRRERRM